MKRNTLRIALILLVFSFQAFAQQNNRALKFDEFDDSQENFYSLEEISLTERIKRFVTQIKKERGKKIYIIYYRARITAGSSQYKISNWAERTKTEIIASSKLTYDDVFVVDGGYREKNTLEYWIAPKSSEPPKATPTFSKDETFTCPNI
jgi:protein involved in sex pheromone biosynthesis